MEEAAKTAQKQPKKLERRRQSLIKSLNGEKETLKKVCGALQRDMIEAFKKAFGLEKDGKKAEGSKATAEAKGTGTVASGKTSAKKKKTTAKTKKEEKEWQVYRETKEYEKARKKIEQGTQAEMQAVMAEVERMQNTIASLNPWVQARRSTCHHHRSAWQIISRCSYRLRSIPRSTWMEGFGQSGRHPTSMKKHEHNTEPAKGGEADDVQDRKYKMGDFGLKLLGVDLGTPSVRKSMHVIPGRNGALT